VEARDLVTDNKGDRAGQWGIGVNDQFRIRLRRTEVLDRTAISR